LKKLALNFDVFDIKDWDWISKVIWRKNSIKFKSVLSRFPTQFAWDKVEIKWDTISLIRNWSILKSLSLGWETKMKLSINTESDNNIEIFKSINKDLDSMIKNPIDAYWKKQDAIKNKYLLLKKEINWKYGSKIKNNRLYSEINIKYSKNIPWTYIAKWLKNRNYTETTELKNKKELPLTWHKNTIKIFKRENFNILALYNWEWKLVVWAYTSPWQTLNKSIQNYVSKLKNWWWTKTVLDKDHVRTPPKNSKHKSKNALMTYAVHVKWFYSIHYWKTNWKPRSLWCFRLWLHYAKWFYDEIEKIWKKIWYENINIDIWELY